MFNGDRSRKKTLVDYGFRLPSALDNRPLGFDEFLERLNQTVFVSATPGDWELERSEHRVVEQIIRPTGLVDPNVEVRATRGQVDDLLTECKKRQNRDERVLITTLTKRLAEDLTEFMQQRGVPTKYMHSDIDTLERVSIVQSLREGAFSVLVGINLLREGLDIPEVSLVAILDADKEGFLRSGRSLIQTFGRAARNEQGRVIMYADRRTKAMQQAIEETERRRQLQMEHNRRHNITPQTIKKSWNNPLHLVGEEAKAKKAAAAVAEEEAVYSEDPKAIAQKIQKLERSMRQKAQNLEFEQAAELRDRIATLREVLVKLG
jgi:excinuclease ABC subunit B